eukprot:71077-Prymnesium_polylepis.1
MRGRLAELEKSAGELQREVELGREAHAGLEVELERERKAAADYRATEEFLSSQGQQRQNLELDEGRKRIGALETKLKEAHAKASAAEKQAQAYAAELASRPIAPSPERQATAAETMQALAALHQKS